jgi:hypothetical protein
VFAVRATVLRVCPVMCKVSRGSTGAQEETRAVLSAAEASVLHGVLQAPRTKIMDSVDRAEELKLENLLDDLCCDQEIVDAMLVSDVLAHDCASFALICDCAVPVVTSQNLEKGCDVYLDDMKMRQVIKTRDQVQAYSHTVAQKIYEERSAHLAVQETCYQDVLVRCSVSGRVAWLRWSQRRGGGGGQLGAGDTRVDSQVVGGGDLLVTYVRPGRAPVQPAAVQVFYAGDQSSVKVLMSASRPGPAAPSEGSGVQAGEGSISVLSASGVCVHSCLRDLHVLEISGGAGTTATSGTEVDFIMTVLEWHTTPHGPVVAGSTEPAQFTDVVVFGADDQRHGVVLCLTLPTELVGRVPWLSRGARVAVSAAVVVHVDGVHDILRVARGDRTLIVAQDGSSHSGSGTDTRKRPRSAWAQAALPATKKGPAVLESPATATAVSSPLSVSLPVWVWEDERRRYSALRDSAGCFVPSNQEHDLERCERLVIPIATLNPTACSGGGASSAGTLWVDVADASAGGQTRLAMLDRQLLQLFSPMIEVETGRGKDGELIQEKSVSPVRVVLSQCHHQRPAAIAKPKNEEEKSGAEQRYGARDGAACVGDGAEHETRASRSEEREVEVVTVWRVVWVSQATD